jgi:uncharacterized protein YdhG (YjbR/CyaY superfamily)
VRELGYHRRDVTDDSPIDAYLASLPADQRAALERVREHVKRLVPDAEEGMSYGMPVLKLRGKALIWFAGWKEHCSLYPLTDSFLAAHENELEGFDHTKGSVHFMPDAPLPDHMLESMVRARVADLEAGG